MPHDAPEHWHEIVGNTKKAGFGQYQLKPFPYGIFMEEQGLPVFRDFGVSKVQNSPVLNFARNSPVQVVTKATSRDLVA